MTFKESSNGRFSERETTQPDNRFIAPLTEDTGIFALIF
jgi:hypothetical protein